MSEQLEHKKRRIIRPYEIVLLVLVGFVLLHFSLKSMGVDTVKRSEEVSWLDQPSGPEKFIPPVVDEQRERSVDEVLNNIAVQFAEDKSKNRVTSKRELKEKGLSEDEAQFYKDIQQREGNERRSPADWIGTVQTSYKTYKTVKSIFEKMDGTNDDEVDAEDMNKVLSDPELKDITFAHLERTFQISRPMIEAFANRGSRALSDWATFIDQNKK